MSHITRMELKVTDLDSLKKAAEDLGHKLTTDVSQLKGTRLESYNGKKSVAALEVGGKKAFGFIKNDDGSYQMVGDSYGLGISVDKLQKHLHGRYALHMAAKTLRRNGFTVTHIPQGTSGKVTLTASKGF